MPILKIVLLCVLVGPSSHDKDLLKTRFRVAGAAVS